jgi:hypothetical protein
MERSEIRDPENAEVLIPDCAALHPGYKLRLFGSVAFCYPLRCSRVDESQLDRGANF